MNIISSPFNKAKETITRTGEDISGCVSNTVSCGGLDEINNNDEVFQMKDYLYIPHLHELQSHSKQSDHSLIHGDVAKDQVFMQVIIIIIIIIINNINN